jgi:hypothetical protein
VLWDAQGRRLPLRGLLGVILRAAPVALFCQPLPAGSVIILLSRSYAATAKFHFVPGAYLNFPALNVKKKRPEIFQPGPISWLVD